jgi:hypothetical protein
MSVKVKTTPKRTATLMIGFIIGSVISRCVRQNPAPSTAAASGISFGIEVSPASRITVENGIIRQEWTAMTDAIARLGSPSHIGGSKRFTRCSCARTQFTTE